MSTARMFRLYPKESNRSDTHASSEMMTIEFTSNNYVVPDIERIGYETAERILRTLHDIINSSDCNENIITEVTDNTELIQSSEGNEHFPNVIISNNGLQLTSTNIVKRGIVEIEINNKE